jgi:heterodisulfide reductase subunit C
METDNDKICMKEMDFSFAEEVMSHPGGENLRKCFACGTCTAGCPISEIDEAYSPRRIIRQILFGMRKEVLTSPAIWYCLVCYRCYAHCPQKVNFPDLMRVLRYLAIKGDYANPDLLDRIHEIDKSLQTFRHDLIKYDVVKQSEDMNRKHDE